MYVWTQLKSGSIDRRLGFRQTCPTRSYSGLWEMVINQLEASDVSCATLDSCPPDLSGQDILNTLVRNFNRHYSTNRAPFGIHLQAAWFENSEYLAAFQVSRKFT